MDFLKIREPHIPFFIFLFVFFYVYHYPTDIFAMAIPGWHVTILPQPVWINIFVYALMVSELFFYWTIGKHKKPVNVYYFIAHLGLTLMAAMVMRILPLMLVMKSMIRSFRSPETMLTGGMDFRIMFYVLFLLGQVCFFMVIVSGWKGKSVGIQ